MWGCVCLSKAIFFLLLKRRRIEKIVKKEKVLKTATNLTRSMLYKIATTKASTKKKKKKKYPIKTRATTTTMLKRKNQSEHDDDVDYDYVCMTLVMSTLTPFFI